MRNLIISGHHRTGNWVCTVLLGLMLTSGCSTIIQYQTMQMGENLTHAILNSNDPELAKSAIPTYMLLMDSLIEGSPQNIQYLSSGAQLYSIFPSLFVDDIERRKKLTQRAFAYANKAFCLETKLSCSPREIKYQIFVNLIAELDKESVPVIYTLGSAWISWINEHRDDLHAIADLPKAELLMKRVVELDEGYQQGGAHLYMGVLSSLLPPLLGGKPDIAQQHFEKAIALSRGKNLYAKVLYAKHYARVIFDKSLHDQLLQEVIASDPTAYDLNLINLLAQKKASELLESSNDYF